MGLTRTERDFQRALLTLLAEQSFMSLSVEQICNETMMHRSSFYRYFNDKDDLLKHTVNTKITSLIDASDNDEDEIENVVDWLVNNKDILRNLATGRTNSSLYATLVNILSDIMLNRYDENVDDRLVHAISLFDNHETGAYMLSSAVIGAFYWWRSQDYVTSKEVILKHAHNFIDWLDQQPEMGGHHHEKS